VFWLTLAHPRFPPSVDELVQSQRWVGQQVSVGGEVVPDVLCHFWILGNLVHMVCQMLRLTIPRMPGESLFEI